MGSAHYPFSRRVKSRAVYLKFKFKVVAANNVKHPAAHGGGAAEEGGQHQEDLCLPSSGGHQEVCVGYPVFRLPPAGLHQRQGQPVQGEVLVMSDYLENIEICWRSQN